MKAIDLFCGCGGISSGLRSAGFEIIAGIDVDRKYIATFRHNFRESISIDGDLLSITPEDFMNKIGIKRGELDILAGGPPCQGFSKNVPRKYRFLEDPKNLLINRFLDYCEAVSPNIVLMENVAEMKNGFSQLYTEEIVDRLQNEGYSISHAVLNAADYGVPQRRRRAFFIGIKSNITPRFPQPTHSNDPANGSLFDLRDHVSVWEAIGDLPPVKHGEGAAVSDYDKSPFSEYQKAMRGYQNRLHNHVARRLQPMQYQRLAALKPGQGLQDLPEHLKVNGGYSGAYGRLTKDMIAPTITRWVFHPGSGRWGHPEEIRTLTIREVARIQGFSDAFTFVGSYNDQAGQLGNAVPSLLAQRIGEKLAAYL